MSGAAFDIMKGGFSAGQARAINGQTNSAVSAAGTTQSDATELKASMNYVSTVGASSGVVLPSNSEIGDEIVVYNAQGSNQLTVYPPSGGAINQLSANTGMLLAVYTAVMLRKITSTQWVGFLSA